MSRFDLVKKLDAIEEEAKADPTASADLLANASSHFATVRDRLLAIPGPSVDESVEAPAVIEAA